ncbi:MAG: GAF domain-containing protein [Oscillatoriales cyanobacterium]|nr:MAG: GAF domain-containing protein [Oscillatoriales cyanobacterium]TAF69720.1 MAG: GAF domain-containing protein [Oscillatoriales cyanobacterium]
MQILPGYRISASISEGFNTSVYRGIRNSDEQPVIIKILKAEFPTLEQITRLKHEYKITQNLHIEGIVKAYSLETYQNRIALILEDFGGDVLSHSTKLNLPAFLNIAVQLASTLKSLHRNGIIHKDIKPSNIIINSATGIVTITDFSVASRLSKENPQLNNLNLVEGTVAYMSPEQTGRMNRTLDYRTDFYSLGVTFYEMLTGKLPFNNSDILEIVHCHIAKQAIPPEKLNPEIPQVISDIVMKLLEKNAEDRYQTAEGLKADLEICLNSLQQIGEIVNFRPGKLDRSGQLLIPQKLYGREAEVDCLLAAFERVGVVPPCLPPHQSSNGRVGYLVNHGGFAPTKNETALPFLSRAGGSEIVLVSGYSGIGKTAIVNEIHKPIVRQRGYFVKGKFDQFKRDIPYAALIQAFQSLIWQLLTESTEKLQTWREKISAALGEQGKVIAEVIPEVELIIGKQPEVPQIGPAEAQNRFNRVFKEFIGIFTKKEHPLVIFLDDLQWADSASLNLMQLLVSDAESLHLLLIGAYRDNEVSPTHPLLHAIAEIEKTGTPIHNIVLEPLKFGNVRELIADTLCISSLSAETPELSRFQSESGNEKVKLLAELIFNKTGGNPFFLTQLLQALYQEKLLKFEFDSGNWQWNLEEIQAIGITDKNVVELIASRIKKLPKTTQQILKLAACIGNIFTLDVLSVVSKESPTVTASELWPALQSGLVLPLNDAYKIPLVGDWELGDFRLLADSRSPISYKFLHDRVQQAAYSLIPDSDKKATHLKIGQLLLQNGGHSSTSLTDRGGAAPTASDLAENVFDIVNQLNIGVEFITEKTEKDELAKLNLIAGKKAKASNAYEAAVRYLNAGLELLAADSWQTDYQLTLNLYVAATEAEYLNTNFERSQYLADVVLQQAVSVLDKIKVYEIQIQSYMSQNQMLKAIDTGLRALEISGFSLSEIPPEGLAGIKLPQLEELDNIPVMTDEYQLAAMRILSVILTPAFAGKPELFPQIIFTMVDLCVKYGHSALGAIAYSWYGLLLAGALGEIDAGYHAGKLSLKLLEQFNAKEFKCKVYHLFNTFVRHWKEHARETIPPLMEGIQSGLETGDLEFSSYNALNCCSGPFLIGEPLENVNFKQIKYLELSIKLKQNISSEMLSIWGQIILNLLGQSDTKSQLIGDRFNEVESLPRLQATNNYMSLFKVYFAKMLLSYLFKEPEEALASASLAAEYAKAAVGFMMIGTHNLYYSLALLAVYPTADSEQQQQYLMQVVANQEKMQKWAHHAPMNYQHKYDLVEAEKARICGENWAAGEYYDRAIEGAKEQGYTQEEALANELAAEFYYACKKDKIARVYLTEAYYGYIRWGAIAKVKDLEARYPQLVTQTLNQPPKSSNVSAIATTTTINSSLGNALDVGTFIKASQAITSEIVLEKLLASLITILLENAAAQKAVLMLFKGDRLLIEATCTAEKQQATVLQSIPVENSQDLPISVVNYVARTQKNLVLHDATSETLFNTDAYIVSNQPKSILCSPIIYQGHLTGILYLENNLAVSAFTAERLQILNLLTAQVAIGVENAQLYAREQEKSQLLEQSLHKLQQTQAQLVQTEKISSLGQLVAGVAHEVNNPVGFISGNLHHAVENINDLINFVNLYQEHYPNPVAEIVEAAAEINLDYLIADLPKMLASMKLGTDRIREIMQSLRNFSRIDGNQKQAADIHAGIDSTLMILQHRLKAQPDRPAIQVIKKYGDFRLVKCYSGQLNQVFMNLLGNAIDALNESNADRTYDEIESCPNTIEIRTCIQEGTTLAISIADNGCGMTPEVRSKLLEPFFTTKPAGKGTGLGLSISHSIVAEKHGGTLKCNSTPGAGSEFVIEIPLSDSIS